MTTEKHNPDDMLTDRSFDLTACIQKVERLSNCIEIANLINSELSIGKLLSNVMETTQKAFNADGASLLLLDEETGDLTFQIALSEVGDEIKELYRLEKGQGIGGLVAETGEPVNLADAYDHPRFSRDYDKKTHYRTKAMLCVPLKVRGRIIGVIQVINKLSEPYVFTDDELDMLITIAGSAAVAIDTAKMHKIILKRETLERDLKLAREVQESFLPKELPQIERYLFDAAMHPALEIGGDFYNFFKLPAGKIGVVLGDVSGKGISASLFMARLSSDLQYYTLLHPEPGALLTAVNDLLCERAKRGMFVTLIYLLLDTVENTMRVANAGHMSPVYSDEDGTLVLRDNSVKGPPLGIMPGVAYESKSFDLDPGSSITLYTDGVIEAKDASGHLFGIQRLLKIIGQQPNDPGAIVRNITRSVDRFTTTEGRSDDLTLLTFCLES